MDESLMEASGIERFWAQYTDSEKSLFQRACRRLLKNTFIVRDKDEEHRREYFFVSRNPDPLNAFFEYIGMQVMVDRDHGVIMLRNGADSGEGGRMQLGHVILTKLESLVLLCLWTIYSDRITAGQLTRTVTVTMPELRYELEKFGIRDVNEKTVMAECLTTLSGYCLLERVGRLGDEDFRLVLYPSLLFCLDMPRFRALVEAARRRMAERDGNENNAISQGTAVRDPDPAEEREDVSDADGTDEDEGYEMETGEPEMTDMELTEEEKDAAE